MDDFLDIQKELNKIRKIPCNLLCSDCQSCIANIVILNYGIFVCENCYKIHYSINQYEKALMAADLHTKDEYQILARAGNDRANEYWEYALPKKFKRPKSNDVQKLSEFIYDKYINKKWIDKSVKQPGSPFTDVFTNDVSNQESQGEQSVDNKSKETNANNNYEAEPTFVQSKETNTYINYEAGPTFVQSKETNANNNYEAEPTFVQSKETNANNNYEAEPTFVQSKETNKYINYEAGPPFIQSNESKANSNFNEPPPFIQSNESEANISFNEPPPFIQSNESETNINFNEPPLFQQGSSSESGKESNPFKKLEPNNDKKSEVQIEVNPFLGECEPNPFLIRKKKQSSLQKIDSNLFLDNSQSDFSNLRVRKSITFTKLAIPEYEPTIFIQPLFNPTMDEPPHFIQSQSVVTPPSFIQIQRNKFAEMNNDSLDIDEDKIKKVMLLDLFSPPPFTRITKGKKNSEFNELYNTNNKNIIQNYSYDKQEIKYDQYNREIFNELFLTNSIKKLNPLKMINHSKKVKMEPNNIFLPDVKVEEQHINSSPTNLSSQQLSTNYDRNLNMSPTNHSKLSQSLQKRRLTKSQYGFSGNYQNEQYSPTTMNKVQSVQSVSQYPIRINNQYPPQTNSQYRHRTSSEYSTQSNSQYPPQTNSQYPPRTNNQYHHRTSSEYSTQSNSQYRHRTSSEYLTQSNNQYPPQTNSQYPSQSNSQYPSQTNSQYPSQTNNQYTSQSNSQYPSQTNNQYPSQSNSQYYHRTSSEYLTQSNNQYPPQTNSQYPSQSNNQYPPQTNSQYPFQSNSQYSININSFAPRTRTRRKSTKKSFSLNLTNNRKSIH